MKKKIMIGITIFVWCLVALLVYKFLLNTEPPNIQTQQKIVKVGQSKNAKATKILSKALVDEMPLGFLKSNEYVNNIIEGYFFNWDINKISLYFSDREKSKKNVEIIKNQIGNYKNKYGNYKSSKIQGFKLLDFNMSLVTVDVEFEKETATVDFVLIEKKDKSGLELFLFRFR